MSTTRSHGPYWLSEDSGVRRLACIRSLVGRILQDLQPDLVCIEDYSYASKFQAHQLGEVGGVLRLELHAAGIPYIAVAPTSVKKFLTNKGHATKLQMVKAAASDAKARGLELPAQKGLTADLRTDVADAYAMARLLYACLASEGEEAWRIKYLKKRGLLHQVTNLLTLK